MNCQHANGLAVEVFGLVFVEIRDRDQSRRLAVGTAGKESLDREIGVPSWEAIRVVAVGKTFPESGISSIPVIGLKQLTAEYFWKEESEQAGSPFTSGPDGKALQRSGNEN